MEVTQQTMSGTTILDLSGRFEFTARKVFSSALEKTLEGGTNHIVFNFTKVSFLDSSALGLLAISSQNLKLKNIRVCLVNPQGNVRKVLELANFPTLVPIFDSIEEATRATPVA